MDLITRGLATGLFIWFALLAALVAGRLLRGDMATGGLLHHRHHDAHAAPERVLSMALFPLVVVSYAYGAVHADMSVSHPSLPDLPDNLLMLLTGGNGLYLAGKIARP